jgi:outer membrane protein OmpU
MGGREYPMHSAGLYLISSVACFASWTAVAADLNPAAVATDLRPLNSEIRWDYSGLLVPQLGVLQSKFTLAPMSRIPFPQWDNDEVIGRFYGRIDVVPSYLTFGGRLGLHAGLYSNLNTAYYHRRGIVPLDRVNLELTRIRPETPLDFDRLHLFHESDYGRFELGWVSGISERTAVTAPLNWGVGSVGGDYPYFLDKPLDVGFHTLTAYGSANTSPRIAYFSPRLWGYELGVSYQPDTRNTGFNLTYGGRELGLLGRRRNTDQSIFHENILVERRGPWDSFNGSFEGHTAGFTDLVEAGIRSDHTYFGDIRVRTSLAGIVGSAVSSSFGTPFNDLRSFQAGLQVGYRGWTIGGGYVWAGDSGYAKTAHWRQRLNQYSAHVGIQYETGRWTFGAAFLNSDDAGDPTERSDVQLHVYSAGLRYKVNDEVDLGFEFNRILPLSADYGDYTVYAGLAQLRYRFGTK